MENKYIWYFSSFDKLEVNKNAVKIKIIHEKNTKNFLFKYVHRVLDFFLGTWNIGIENS